MIPPTDAVLNRLSPGTSVSFETIDLRRFKAKHGRFRSPSLRRTLRNGSESALKRAPKVRSSISKSFARPETRFDRFFGPGKAALDSLRQPYPCDNHVIQLHNKLKPCRLEAKRLENEGFELRNLIRSFDVSRGDSELQRLASTGRGWFRMALGFHLVINTGV